MKETLHCRAKEWRDCIMHGTYRIRSPWEEGQWTPRRNDLSDCWSHVQGLEEGSRDSDHRSQRKDNVVLLELVLQTWENLVNKSHVAEGILQLLLEGRWKAAGSKPWEILWLERTSNFPLFLPYNSLSGLILPGSLKKQLAKRKYHLTTVT